MISESGSLIIGELVQFAFEYYTTRV